MLVEGGAGFGKTALLQRFLATTKEVRSRANQCQGSRVVAPSTVVHGHRAGLLGVQLLETTEVTHDTLIGDVDDLVVRKPYGRFDRGLTGGWLV